jgi:hypothetical protein
MNFLNKFFKPKKQKPVQKPAEVTEIKKSQKTKSAKDMATEQGEPYVAIVSMDIDPNNIHQGSFELDWNERFVSNLIRAGYMIKREDTDAEIVDRWFQNICRHVVMETYEQEQAMNPNRYVYSRDIGNGRQEIG